MNVELSNLGKVAVGACIWFVGASVFVAGLVLWIANDPLTGYAYIAGSVLGFVGMVYASIVLVRWFRNDDWIQRRSAKIGMGLAVWLVGNATLIFWEVGPDYVRWGFMPYPIKPPSLTLEIVSYLLVLGMAYLWSIVGFWYTVCQVIDWFSTLGRNDTYTGD